MAASSKIKGVVIVMVLLIVNITSQASCARLLVDGSLSTSEQRIVLPEVGIISPTEEQLIGKYRPLLLNLLPRGPVPPSGPSKRTNNSVN
ncbi:hypothetical protein P3X46_007994 [Hevea brasiliensis]|uniref:Uncharacterized protein n=1 Tax=Hevea brasiliensis TaxID=3981 RepID=A0ABQ9MH31_HEVBR|nr:hypothetical protein P3X46_007994 [Hevea brasiliensis]